MHNKTLKILVVDDERPAREELKYLLQSAATNLHQSIQLSEASDGHQALQMIHGGQVHGHQWDAIFLDINMNDTNGLAVARELDQLENAPILIFATAYDRYALEAFEVSAFDYLLKPFNPDRVQKTLERLLTQHQKSQLLATSNISPQENLKAAGPQESFKRLALWQDDRIVLLDYHQIVYLMAVDGQTAIKAVSGTYTTKDTLCCIEKKLIGQGFVRAHRSFIVNADHIQEIIPWFNKTYVIKVQHYFKDEIPVSRNYVRDIKALFGL